MAAGHAAGAGPARLLLRPWLLLQGRRVLRRRLLLSAAAAAALKALQPRLLRRLRPVLQSAGLRPAAVALQSCTALKLSTDKMQC